MRAPAWAARLQRRHVLLGAGALAVAFGVALWAGVRARQGAPAVPSAAAAARHMGNSGGMAGMEGMPGMSGMESGGRSAMPGMPGMAMPAGGEARLDASQLRQFGVTFGRVDLRVLRDDVRAAGVVAVDETRLTQVTTRTSGFVERLHANFTGRAVRRGEPLLDLYSPEVLATEEELLVAARLPASLPVPGVEGRGLSLVAAARERLVLLGMPRAQIAEVLRTGRARRTFTVVSPATGVVTEKRVIEGQAVQSGQPLLTIADLAGVWIEAQLRETDASRVRVGSGADVELAALPGRSLKGTVTFVEPVLQSATRSVTARVSVANAGGQLRPGMSATVRIVTPGREVLTVPTDALVRTGDRTLVFVDRGGGRLTPADVEVGATVGPLTEVLGGLQSGQRVVTSAQFLLDSESNLAEVMRGMIGQMGGASAEGRP